MQFNS